MEDIKCAIEEEKYKYEDKIPSEPELSELYSVSRITVRRAVDELCTEGYLIKKQGKGTYVGHPKLQRKIERADDAMILRLAPSSYISSACIMRTGSRSRLKTTFIRLSVFAFWKKRIWSMARCSICCTINTESIPLEP